MLGSRCDGGCCEVTKPVLMRLLVAAVIACGANGVGAQSSCDGDCPPPRPRPGPVIAGHSDSGNGPVVSIISVLGAIAVLGIWNYFNPGRNRDFGTGLVNALDAVNAAKPK